MLNRCRTHHSASAIGSHGWGMSGQSQPSTIGPLHRDSNPTGKRARSNIFAGLDCEQRKWQKEAIYGGWPWPPYPRRLLKYGSAAYALTATFQVKYTYTGTLGMCFSGVCPNAEQEPGTGYRVPGYPGFEAGARSQ
eukprot:1600743-Rhodomonas_salina.3